MDYFIIPTTARARGTNESDWQPVKVWLISRQRADAIRLAGKVSGPGGLQLIAIYSTDDKSIDGLLRRCKDEGCHAMMELMGWNADGSPRLNPISSEMKIGATLN